MKAGWQTKTLGDVCDFQRGLTYTKGDEVEESANIVLRATNIELASNLLNFSELKYISNEVVVPDNKKVKFGSLLICTASGSKSHLGKVAYIDDDYGHAFGGFMGMITPKKELYPKFLFYLMTSNAYKDFIATLSDGVNINNLKFDDLKQFVVPLPPISEQQRIVAILDEAFEGIATATANAKKNLTNARELFDSTLQSVFTHKGEGWIEKRIEECFKLKSGDGLTSKMMGEDGAYPVFGGNGIAGFHNSFNLKGSNVIIGRVGALCGNVRHISENIWLTDNAFKVVDFKHEFNNSFLTYLLNFKNLRGFARQAAQPVISNSSLKDVLLQFPTSLSQQQRIATKLDELSTETKKLEAIYQQKLVALEELKKSILNQAFSGQLH